MTEDEWNSPLTLRFGEWRTMQDRDEQQHARIAELEAEIAEMRHDLERAVARNTELLNERKT